MKTTKSFKNYGEYILYYMYAMDKALSIPGKFDLKNTTAKEWLRIISQNSNKTPFSSAPDDISKLRFLKKLWKVAKDIELTEEYILVSSFCNIMIDREQTRTKVVGGEEMKEYIKNPYDFDYLISPKKIAKILEEKEVEEEEKEIKQEIFSITTHDSSTGIPACPNCKGKGFFKCEECEGSGREQYVDGYYASGEERIKTGQCSHCYGRGKIECEACNGAGKQEIHSDKYQIIQLFGDEKKLYTYTCFSSTCGELQRGYDYGTAFFWREHEDSLCYLGNDELEQCIDKLYKCQNEIITDNNKEQSVHAILKKMGREDTDLYKENKTAAYRYWEEEKDFNGQLGCSLENHTVIPAIKIHCQNKVNEDDIDIFIVEYHYNHEKDKVQQGVWCLFENISELSFLQSLFLR
jgi:hypothetical protein